MVAISAVGNSVVQIAAGTELSLALNSNGTAWSWGSNIRGQQGRRTPHYYYEPTVGNAVAKPKLIPDPALETPPAADQEVSPESAWKNIVQIKAGGTLALAVVKHPEAGTRGLWAWGYGGGITHDSSTKVVGSEQPGSNYPAFIGAHTPASLELGYRTLLAAFDAPGEILDMRMGSANSIEGKPPVLTSHPVSILAHQTVQLKKIASGIPTDFADSRGVLRTTGWHTASKVPLDVTSPHRVAGVGASFWCPTDRNNFAQTFYANLYLTEDFRLMMYRTGAVGSNGYTLLSFPHSEIAPDVVSIATHAYPQGAEKLFVALLANGTVKMLNGVYSNGGNGPAAYTLVQSVPLAGMANSVDVSSLSNIMRISVGQNHCGAIDRNGDVWMWGKNNNGQLGDGTTVDRATPIKVTVPQGASFLACGRFTTHVIARDGKVYAWGNGYLGKENVAFPHFSASPLEITSLSGKVTSIHCGFEGGGSATMKQAHYLAIGRNGGVYAWGFNGQGRLGDTTIGGERTAPYLLSHHSMTNIVEAYAAAQTSLFRREDGKVYGCGNNNNALVGNACGYIMGESSSSNIWYSSPEVSLFDYYVEID
jgi:alpha-tubulin suppressor-like RCC1 family protein